MAQGQTTYDTHRSLSRLVCTAVVGVLVGAFAPCHADTLDRIKSKSQIVLGHREASIPLSYLSANEPMGYSLDVCKKLAAALAKSLGISTLAIAHKVVTSATRFEAVEKGEIDLECGSTTNNAARRERVAFTIPHFIASARLMVKGASDIERFEQLDGKKVASTAGTTNVESLKREARLKGVVVDVLESKDHAEGMTWVINGKADAFAMDDIILFGLQANAPDAKAVKIVGKPITIEPYAIAFEKNNPRLKQIIDAEMRRLIYTRELHGLYDKWFLNPIPPKGLNLNMRMPHLLSDSLKYPSDYVPN